MKENFNNATYQRSNYQNSKIANNDVRNKPPVQPANQTPVTKKEVENIKQNLSKPKPSLNLEPDGSNRVLIDEQIRNQQQERLKFAQARLQEIHQYKAKEFDKAANNSALIPRADNQFGYNNQINQNTEIKMTDNYIVISN